MPKTTCVGALLVAAILASTMLASCSSKDPPAPSGSAEQPAPTTEQTTSTTTEPPASAPPAASPQGDSSGSAPTAPRPEQDGDGGVCLLPQFDDIPDPEYPNREPRGPNQQPLISSVTDQTLAEADSTNALPFQVIDDDTSAYDLVLSTASDNLDLVPLANISIAGASIDRTVTVQTATDRTGTARITISVSDGELVTNMSFLVTVLAPPTSPAPEPPPPENPPPSSPPPGPGEPAPSITVSPIGAGGSLFRTQTHDVNWSTTGNVGSVDVLLSSNGGTTFPTTLTTIASGAPQVYHWGPLDLAPANNYVVRVRAANDHGVSDDSGTLNVASPSIAVDGPPAGDNWRAGTSVTARWSAPNLVGNVDILYAENGSTFVAVASDVANDGTQAITLPDQTATGARLGVRSHTDPSITDVSDTFDVTTRGFRYYRLQVGSIAAGCPTSHTVVEGLAFRWDGAWRANALNGTGKIGPYAVSASSSNQSEQSSAAHPFRVVDATTNAWISDDGTYAHSASPYDFVTDTSWVKVDFGSGVVPAITGMKLKGSSVNTGCSPDWFWLEGSSDDTAWYLITGSEQRGQDTHTEKTYTWDWTKNYLAPKRTGTWAGLLAYYPFDEAGGTRKNVANGAYPAYIATPAPIGSESGVTGNALSFELTTTGTGGGHTLAVDSVAMDFSGGVGIAGWIKVESVGNGGVQFYLFSTSNVYHALFYDSSSHRFAMTAYTVNGAYTATANTFGSPTLGVWYFVAGWTDGVNVHVSVNNGPADAMPVNGALASHPIASYIRVLQGWGSGYSRASIDEVGVWNRPLTSADLTELYSTKSYPSAP